MTVKQFFKSTAFKCIIALLAVLLVSGVFLTIMNSVLEVTSEERLSRAISKIYGKSVQVTAETDLTNYNDNATIEEVYKVKDDGNYLIKATGRGGYDFGSVTCWVVVKITDGSVKGIDKVVIDSNKGQTQIAELNSRFLNKFTTGYKDEDNFQFSPNNGFLVTNSTMSSTAVCNAVNGALDYAKAKCGVVTVDIYKVYEFAYLTEIDSRNTKHVVNEDLTVTYTAATNGYGNAGNFTIQITVGTDGRITKYDIKTNGSTSGYESDMAVAIKDGTWFVGKNAQDILSAMGGDAAYGSIKGGLTSNSLATGATQSSYLCIQAAVFATANYQLCVSLYQNEGIGGAVTGGEENE